MGSLEKPVLGLDVSTLQFSQEAIGLIGASLVLEAEASAAVCDRCEVGSDLHLQSMHRAFVRDGRNIILAGPVVAGGAPGLTISIAFNPECYRLIAEAAKQCVAGEVGGA